MSNKQPVDKLKETPKSPNVATGAGRAVASSATGAVGSGLGGVLGSTLGTTLLTTAITSAIVSYGVTSITGGSGTGPIGPDLSLTGTLGVDGLASLNGGIDTTTISADTINVTTLNLSGPISLSSVSDLTVTNSLTVDTNTLVVDPVGNNVGVGSATPTEKLDVAGNIKATGTVSATDLSGTLTTPAQTNITSVGTLSALTVTGDLTVDTNVLKVNSTTNRVGVNNSAPTEALDVTGNIKASGSILGTLGTGVQPNITSTGTLSSLTVSGDLTVDTNTLKVDSANNRVGVNNSAPTEALDVTGNIKSSGSITGSTLSGTLTTGPQPNITSLSALSSLTVTGDLTVDTNTLKVDSANNRVGVNNSTPSEALDVIGNIKASGTIAGTLSTSAQPNITSTGTLSSLTVSGDLTVDTNTLKVDSTNNRVGVNNALPTEALDVTGNIKSSGSVTGSTLSGTISTAAQPNITSLGTLSSLTVSGNLNVDSNTLKVDSALNHVGVNNASPTEALDVTGNIKSSGTITGTNLAGTLTTAAQGNVTSLGTLSSLTVSGDLIVDTNTLKVDSTNNHVGINNSLPTEALDVTGNIKASGSVTGSTLSGTISTAAQPNITSLGTLSSLTVSGNLNVDSDTLKVDSALNHVGINNASPSEALDVTGNIKSSGTITGTNLEGTLTTAAQGNVTSLGTLTALTVTGDLTVDTNTLKVDSANNRVGVNNATPSEALDVVGNVQVSGTITGTLATAAQTNITSVGTLSSLVVSGDLTVDTNTLKVDSLNNRVGVNNATPSEALDVSGNIVSSGSISGSTLSGTISTAAQPNITSTGTLSSLTVSGDLTVDTNTLKVDSTNNRVGVNNATPSEALDVSGNVKVSGTISTDDIVSQGSTMNIASTTTGTVNLACGTVSQIVNIGTTANGTTINIGGAGDTVNIGGALNYINTTDLNVTNKQIYVNVGGAAGSGGGAGLYVEEGGDNDIGYLKVKGTRDGWLLKGPAGVEGEILTTSGPHFVTNGSNIYYTTGSVGIGSTTPTVALDVVGNIRATGTVTATGGLEGSFTALNITGDLTVNTDVLRVDTINDRVGINTLNPAYDLDVTGDANVSGTIYGTLGTNSQTNITSVGTLTSLTVSGDVVVDTDVFKVDITNDRVGINTAAPAYDLDVVGDANVSGTIYGTLGTAAQATITSVGTLTSLDVSGDLSVDTDVLKVVSSNNRVGINSSVPTEALDVNGNIVSNGTITGTHLAGTLTTAAQTSITSVGTLTSLDVSGNLSVDTNVLLVDSLNNKVGINSSAPSEALDVNGNIVSNGTITGTSLAGTLTTAAQTSITSVGTLTSLDVSGDLSVDTDVLKVVSSNNRVGINSSVPTEALDVNGNIVSNGTITGTHLAGTLTTAAQTSITSVGTLTSLDVSGNLSVDTNVLLVDSLNNKVGINSSTPSEALDVVGNITSSGTITGTSLAGTLSTAAQPNVTSLGTLTTLTVNGDIAIDTNVLKVDSLNNRVGINSTSPGYALDVSGDANVSGSIYGTLGTAAQTNITSVGTLSSLTVSGDLVVDTNVLKVDSSNNFVGINKTTPAQALDVVGNIASTGTVSGSTVSATTLTGTLSTAAQPNVTSLGTLTSLNVGNINSTGSITCEALTVQGLAGVDTTLDFNPAVGSLQIIHSTGNLGGSIEITSDSGNISLNADSGSSFPTAVSIDGDVTVDTSAFKVVTSTNQVGINTSVPGYTLDVDGPINARIGHTYKIDGTDVLSATSLGSGVTGSSLTSVGTLSSLTVSGDLTVDTNTLYVDSVDNRVGVKTTDPNYPLDVDGAINARVGHTYKINGTDVLSATTLGSGVVNSSLTSVGNLTSLTVDTSTLVVDSVNDRVGINTSVPGYTLDVDGAINARTGHTYKINGTDVLSSTTLGSGVVNSSLTSVGTLSSLTVSGATALNGGLTMDTDKFTVADSTGDVTMAGDLTVDTSALKVVASSNSVGINTSVPGYTLDVDGPINARTGHTYKISGTDVLSATTLGSGVVNSSLTSVGTLTGLTVSGATALNGGLTMDTDKFTVADTTGDVTMAGDLTVDTSALKVVASSNSVGVNTSVPGYTLDVDGPINARVGHTYKINGADVLSSTTLGSGVVNSSLTSVGTLSSLTVSGATALNGGLTMDVDKFTVADTTGNVATSGTLTVTGLTSLNGGLAMDTDKFTVADTTGNVGTTGSLTVAGDVTVDTNTFKVDSSLNRVGIGRTDPQLRLHVTNQSIIEDPDATSWTLRNTPADNSWFSVTWAKELGLLVAVSTSEVSPSVMTSPDGINWTARTTPADYQWTSVAWSPSLNLLAAVAASGTGNRVMTSPNGINWTLRTTPADIQWYSITWSADLSLFVAVSSNGTNQVMTSSDGITWTQRTTPTSSWRSVIWVSDLSLFVAVGSSGLATQRVMTSPDGINWTARTAASANNWQSVAWSPTQGRLVAVASSGVSNRSMYSSNGINWTASPTSDDTSNWQTVIWVGGTIQIFVAVSTSGTVRVMVSADGIGWFARTPAANYDWRSVAWADDLSLLAAVSISGTGNRVMTSGGITGGSAIFDGRVGIGTTTPNYSLDVVGSIAATGTISGSTLTGTLSTAAQGNVTSLGTLTGLTVSGSTALDGGLTMDTDKFTVADTTGNVSTAGTLTVTGLTTLNGGLVMDVDKFTVADTTGNVSTTGTLTVTGLTTLNGGLTMDSGAFAVADTTGNVSTTGTLTVTGLTTLNGGLTMDAGAFAVADTTGNVSTTGTLTVTGDVTVDTNTFKVDSTNNRVGILTTTPSYTLDVRDGVICSNSTGIGTTSLISCSNTWTPAANNVIGIMDFRGTVSGVDYRGASVRSIGANTWSAVNGTPAHLQFSTCNAAITGLPVVRMHIDSNGRVGIGSTTPGSTLDVAGNANVTGDLTVDTNTFKVDSTNNRVGVGTATPGQVLHVFSQNNGTEKIHLGNGTYGAFLENGTGGGYVPCLHGVSSDSDDSGLQIIGELSAGNDVSTNVGLLVQAQIGSAALTNADVLQLNNRATRLVTVRPNGNVGIGSTTPSDKLVVQGDVNIRSGGRISLGDTANNTKIQIIGGQSNGGVGQIQGYDSTTNPWPIAMQVAGGNVGIGTTTVGVKLEVNGSTSISYTSVYLGDGTTVNSATDEFQLVTSSYSTSIRATGYIAGLGLIVTSDQRIKKNISEINDGDALEQLRKVEPAKYEYVDKATRHKGEVYGFIAQQVKEHFPEAVTISRGFVPDVYMLSPIDLTSGTITLGEKAKTGKLRLITKSQIIEPEVELLNETTVKISDESIIIDPSEISDDGKIFVYGYEVDDFHRLNKDYLFTINFAATQELDRQNTQLKSRVQELESQLEAITNALSAKGIL